MGCNCRNIFEIERAEKVNNLREGGERKLLKSSHKYYNASVETTSAEGAG